jgi:hypothetical protein
MAKDAYILTQPRNCPANFNQSTTQTTDNCKKEKNTLTHAHNSDNKWDQEKIKDQSRILTFATKIRLT